MLEAERNQRLQFELKIFSPHCHSWKVGGRAECHKQIGKRRLDRRPPHPSLPFSCSMGIVGLTAFRYGLWGSYIPIAGMRSSCFDRRQFVRHRAGEVVKHLSVLILGVPMSLLWTTRFLSWALTVLG